MHTPGLETVSACSSLLSAVAVAWLWHLPAFYLEPVSSQAAAETWINLCRPQNN